MFTGGLVDTRSRYRKRLDQQQSQPQQLVMFSLRDTYHLGASARPWLKNSARPQLTLEQEDPRTEEEIEADLLREAQELTVQMFVAAAPAIEVQEAPESSQPPPPPVRPAPVIEVVGYRARARRTKARLRTRNRQAKPQVVEPRPSWTFVPVAWV